MAANAIRASGKYGNVDHAENVYAQFVTQSQCESFLVISIIFIAIAIYPTTYYPAHKYKTTHLIAGIAEMPGMLSNILSAFEIPIMADAENDRGVLMR